MAVFPQSVLTDPLSGLSLLHRGKVRDSYELPGGERLVVASDRISVHNYVLPCTIPGKGAVLTALNHYWRKQAEQFFPHDLVAAGAAVDTFLPEQLRGDPALQVRSSVVRNLNMLPCEAVVRLALTGTGFAAYQKDGSVCGHKLPPQMWDGELLPFPIFTPTDKSDVDAHLTADQVIREHGFQLERSALGLFQLIHETLFRRGIRVLDGKFEFGLDPKTGELTLADEVGTLDAMRMCFEGDRRFLAETAGRLPSSLAEQIMRQWATMAGIDPKRASDPDAIALVHAITVPDNVIRTVEGIYRFMFWKITGDKLEEYQRRVMGIDVKPRKVNIVVISGSRSDEPQMRDGMAFLQTAVDLGHANVSRHAISCHRHPEALWKFVQNIPHDTIVIAGAGKAAALPGIVKAFLVASGKGSIPVLGVGFTGDDPLDTLAAQLSISHLPGKPVLGDFGDVTYIGSVGFIAACHSAMEDEFLRVAAPPSSPPGFYLPAIRPPGPPVTAR